MPLDGYTVADTFASITYNTSVTVPYSANNPGAIAVDWPYVYFTVGTQLYVVYVDTVTTGALKEYPPAALIATLRGVARKITISGDLMLIGEDPGASVNLVEAFSIASNANVTPVGNYELNVSYELGTGTSLQSMALNGTNLFVLQSTPGFSPAYSALDVAELGGPRYSTRLGTAATGGFGALSVATRGSRALAVMSDGQANFQLHDIDMHGEFAGTNISYTHSNTWNTGTASYTCGDPDRFSSSTPCHPIAIYGDYAFVAQEPAGIGSPTTIAIYDIGTPALLNCPTGCTGGAPIGTVTASAQVTGLAAGNGYLVASVESATHYVERWDIENISAPTGPVSPPSPSHTNGRAIDLVGRYAWVATTSGFCAYDLIGNSQLGCTTIPLMNGYRVGATSVYVDAGRLYAAEITQAGNPSPFYQFQQYDITTPSAPLAFGAPFGGQLQAVAVAMTRSGPYLFGTEYAASNFEGIGGFVLSTSAGTPPRLVGTSGDFSSIAGTGVAISGPYILAPDQANGLALIRMY